MVSKKARKEKEKTENELELENALFADINNDSDEIKVDDEVIINNEDEISEEEKPLWHDDDDDEVQINIHTTDRLKKLKKTEDEEIISGVEYNKRLREKLSNNNDYSKIFSLPKRRKVGEQDNDDEIFRSSVNFIKDHEEIQGDKIRMRKVLDANSEGYSNCVVQSTRFHPSKNILLTSGFDKNLRLFNIDGKTNSKISSVYYEDLPILSSEWCNNGNNIIISGKRQFFYIYDVNKEKSSKLGKINGCQEVMYQTIVTSPSSSQFTFLGQKGGIYMIDIREGNNIHQLRASSRMNAGQYSQDGNSLYTVSHDGLLYIWDVRSQSSNQIYKDSSLLTATTFAMNQNNNFAIGCTSGVLNMYSFDSLHLETSSNSIQSLTPTKMFNNLTTCINTIRFNKQNTICAYASQSKKDQLRLIHLPSMTVYSNWPTAQTPLSYVNSMDFNFTSEYLAMGNEKGKVVLYTMPFYSTQQEEE